MPRDTRPGPVANGVPTDCPLTSVSGAMVPAPAQLIGRFVRLKIAVVLTIVGLLVMGAGVGQRTVWRPSETVTATLPDAAKQAPVTVIDSAIRDAHRGDVEVTVRADGDFTVAVGRAHDVDAWVGEAAHLTVTGARDGKLVTNYADGEDSVPDPAGSDLWQSEQSADGELVLPWTDPAEGKWSILVAADGSHPAPANVSITWPNDRGTPWALPLIIGGGLLVIIGLALLFLPTRRRRSGPPAPGTRAALREAEREAERARPGRVRAKSGSQAPGSATAPRAVRRGPGAILLSLALVMTAAPVAQADTASPSAEPTGTAEASEPAEPAAEESPVYPVVMPHQLSRIMDEVAADIASADAAKDADKLAERVAGPALTLRKANYRIRAENSKHRAPTAIAAGPILAQVISSSTDWPRTVMTVTQDSDSPVPQAHLLVQQTPRSNYKLVGTVQMLPGTSFPEVADATTGSPEVAPQQQDGLAASPLKALDTLAAALTKPDGPGADEIAENTYVKQITKFQRSQVKDNKEGKITFKHTVAEDDTRAFRTSDGGALVFGYLSNDMVVVPKEDGGTIKLDKDYAVLAGGDSTEGSVHITFGESVLLYVPPAGSDGKIELIGAAQDVVKAKLRDRK